jgi:predicted secreted protein
VEFTGLLPLALTAKQFSELWEKAELYRKIKGTVSVLAALSLDDTFSRVVDNAADGYSVVIVQVTQGSQTTLYKVANRPQAWACLSSYKPDDLKMLFIRPSEANRCGVYNTRRA